MKKILTLVVLISSLFALVACQSAVSNTKVRVVGLSYSSSETTLATIPSNNLMRLLSNKLLADEVEEYIFPGDILTFTVELEDPNFEFISLLSIKFNDRVIRANVDNSIVTTRDCGANICVDFPFEISADKTEYSVQEVKFAKLNSENGVSAIIDNQSVKTVLIDAYNDEIYPYVVSSVALLNELFNTMEYNDLTATDFRSLPINEAITKTYYRMLSIIYLEDSPSTQDGAYQIDGDMMYYHQPLYPHFDSDDSSTWGTYLINGSLVNKNAGYPAYRFIIDAFHSSFQANITASNEGNLIYINIKGEKYFLIEMGKRTRFVPNQVPLEFFLEINGIYN